MRRLRPITRRRRERDLERLPEESLELAAGDDLRPFVPVESAPPDRFTEPPVASAVASGVEPRGEEYGEIQRPLRSETAGLRAPRRGASLGVLLVAGLLIAGGIVGTLLNLDRLELSVPDQWPVGLLLIAGVWLVVALSRRRVTSALGAAVLAGVALSALLDTQGVAPWRDTMLGAVLIALGLGLVLRGLLLRQRTLA